MRVSIKVWKLRLLFATNSDIEEATQTEWIQMQAGDYTPAPPEEEYYDEEEEEEVPAELAVAPPFQTVTARGFGFGANKPNML